MPKISEEIDYNGFGPKIVRLDLVDLINEVRVAVEMFELLVSEEKFANGTQGLRRQIDANFESIGGWKKLSSGGIDWTKENKIGAKVGVEVQVSGRSDMLAVDIMHLKEKIEGGDIDVGVIVVPDDRLSFFLTDRTPNYRTAIRHIEDRARALPIRVWAFRHNGVGPALPKIVTNLGGSRKLSR